MGLNPVLIISVAMPEEAAPFHQAGQITTSANIGGASLTELRYAGQDILVIQSGVGLINAAMGLATASARLAAGATPLVISAGSAGGMVERTLGRLVAGTSFLNVDADATALGYRRGQVPGMPPSYAADATALSIIEAGQPDLLTGAIASTDSFVSGPRAELIATQWPEVLAVDMESVALAQTSYRYGLPFVSLRAVSDLCREPGNAEGFTTHVDNAAELSAAAVLDLAGRLPAAGGAPGDPVP